MFSRSSPCWPSWILLEWQFYKRARRIIATHHTGWCEVPPHFRNKLLPQIYPNVSMKSLIWTCEQCDRLNRRIISCGMLIRRSRLKENRVDHVMMAPFWGPRYFVEFGKVIDRFIFVFFVLYKSAPNSK
jgi:hypothetical protein